MTSNVEQGVVWVFLNYKALGFLTGVSTSVSDHMDQRPRRNNVCRALAQTGTSTANTLHPSMLAASLLFKLCSRHMPSKRIIKAEITLWNTIVQPLLYKTRPAPSVYIDQQALHIHYSTMVSALLFWSLPSLCHWVYCYYHPQIMVTFWQHTIQLANMFLPVATSDLTVQR